MKINEGITEPKKVRCTGCGIVIVLTPHPVNPMEVTPSFPKKTAKPNVIPASKLRLILWGIMAGLALLLAIGLWFTLSGPSDRAAIDGEVSLDGNTLERGTIVFTLEDEKNPITATVSVIHGRYSARASRGPGIGINKVEITTDDPEAIAARFNTKSEIKIDIKAVTNTVTFEVKSK